MGKIKSFIRKIKSKKTLKTYQNPLFITIISLLIVNLIVLVVASIIGVIIDPAYFDNNFFKAFAHALSCMISTNTITKLIDPEILNAHLNVVILSAFIIAIEMILFSGAIIATLTTAVKSFIDKKTKAEGKIELEDHFVILNYNSKVPELIYSLLQKGYKNSVVILSTKSKDEINTAINSLLSSYRFFKTKNKLNLIVKEGNPLLFGQLRDISVDNASSIIIMSNEDMERGDDENITNADLFSLKTLLTLCNFKIKKECNIVVETELEETKTKIENLALTLNSLKEKTIIPISFNRKIGQIISSTIINPSMASIYLQLLSFWKSEFYSYGEEEVDSFLEKHNNAIPIIKYDKLFCLAEDEKDLPLLRSNSVSIKDRKLKTKEVNLSYSGTVFIIGDNSKTPFVLENLKLATVGYGSNFKVKFFHKNDISLLIEDIKKTPGEKKVLILSDDKVSQDSHDANVFETLIALHTTFPERENLSFITELLDSTNLSSIREFHIKNAIISNKLISLLLVQLALNKDAKRFYEALFTTDTEEGGDCFDIIVRPVNSMISEDENLTFANKGELIHSFYKSFDKKYMLIGYIKNNMVTFLAKDQDINEEVKIDKQDSFIFIKY